MEKTINYLKKTLLVIVLYTIGVLSVAAQTTYTVTSTSVGPSTTSGTFLWAVDQANTNPGADIIEFTPGLQVDATVPNVTPATSIMARISESLTIDGKDGALNGIQSWFTVGGLLNNLTACPGEVASTIQVAYMPAFVEIGTSGADNTGIDVSIKNLTIKQFNQVAKINENASLVFENFEANDTWSTYECAGNGMIEGNDGSSLTIRNSRFYFAENWAVIPFGGSINMSDNVGDLIIENSRFVGLNNGDQPAIIYSGAAGSELNIVSSRFYHSGGFDIQGDGVTNMVNSIWTNKYDLVPRPGDVIINRSSGDMNIIASSIMWNSNECDGICQQYLLENLISIGASGNINFQQSAVGFNFETDPGNGLSTLGISGSSTGVFTADEYTWIQPNTQQDAAALKTITSQPSLLTATPAFNSPVFPLGTTAFDIEMVTPAFPGELIDVIPSGTPLPINPIDGSDITLDVVGNPRADANGDRDIGALQLGLAPFLAVTNSGDESVVLSWNEPLHHDGLDILKYEVVYDETGGSSSTTITIDPPALTETISSLTNGTEYEFKVRAIYDAGGVEENGLYSNIVMATPFGPIPTPVVTAVPGDTEVALSWNQPNLDGNLFLYYIIQWALASDPNNFLDAEVITDYNTLSTTVTGLTNGTDYVFFVTVSTVPFGLSSPGSATATPGIYYYYKSTAVGGDWEGTDTWTICLTEDGTYVPTTHQPTESNSISVIIIDGAIVTISTASRTGNSISIESGGVLTLDALATLDVTNGNLTIEADFDIYGYSGSFLENGDLTFSGGGEARMEQYLSKDAYHVVSSPMSNENIGVYEWMYLYSWDEPTKDWTNLVLPETLPLNPGEGYYVWSSTDNPVYPDPPLTVMFNGTFNKNDVITSPTYNSGGQGSNEKGWNLMGNPFPCAIDWNGHAEWNLENVLPTVYLGDYAGSGNYPAWDYSTNTGTLKTDGYIAATQGFWVRTNPQGNPNNATYSLTIPASQRLHSTTTPFYKSDESINEILRLRVDGNNFYDETLIKFVQDATHGFDFYYDAHKMKGREEAPQLYSIVGDEILCMNLLPEVTDDLVVPLGFEVGAAGLYTINASEIEGFDTELFIYLEDLKDNTIRDLKMNPSYSYSASPTDDLNRFLIHFKTSAMDENSLEQFVKIYAYDNKIYVDITGEHGGNVIVYNMLGQEMKTAVVSEGKQSIRINDTGYMLVTLVTEQGVYSEKVFIK